MMWRIQCCRWRGVAMPNHHHPLLRSFSRTSAFRNHYAVSLTGTPRINCCFRVVINHCRRCLGIENSILSDHGNRSSSTILSFSSRTHDDDTDTSKGNKSATNIENTDAWTARWNVLSRNEASSIEAPNTPDEFVQRLDDWSALLNENGGRAVDRRAVVDTMRQHWDASPWSTSGEHASVAPYEPLLRAYTQHYQCDENDDNDDGSGSSLLDGSLRQDDNNSNRSTTISTLKEARVATHAASSSLTILQQWHSAQGGDLQRAPLDAHYHAVLVAYARALSLPPWSESSSTTKPRSVAELVPEAPRVAIEIMDHLEQSYNQEGLPNLVSYGSVVRCLAKGVPHDEGRSTDEPWSQWRLGRVETYMDQMQQQLKNQSKGLSQEEFAVLASALSDALQCLAAVQLFPERSSPDETVPRLGHGSSAMCEMWIDQWKRLLLPENAMLWTQLEESISNSKRRHFIGLDVLEQTTMVILELLYNGMLRISKGDPTLVQSAENMTGLILQLKDLVSGTSPCLLPSARHYAYTIQAWAHVKKLGSSTDCDMAQEQQNLLLEHMQNQHEHTHGNARAPNERELATESWNYLLQSCLEAQRPDRVKELWDSNLLRETIPPVYVRMQRNQHSFTLLLRSLAAHRTNDTLQAARTRASQAHSILSKLIKYSNKQDASDFASPTALPRARVELTSAHFASVMLAWSRGHDVKSAEQCYSLMEFLKNAVHAGRTDLQPTPAHYTALIKALGYSRDPNASHHVLAVFEEMKSAALSSSSHIGGQLSISTYATVLFALSRSKSVKCARQATSILDDIHGSTDIVPTLFCYNAVLYAWGDCESPDSFEQCSIVFRKLVDAYENSGQDPSLRPSPTSYYSLIESLRAGNSTPGITPKLNGPMAESILDQMEVRASEGVSELPDTKVYTAVMKAYLKDAQQNSTTDVERILARMKNSYLAGNVSAKPDAYAMTVVLQVWAKSEAQDKAVIAWSIVNDMRKSYEGGDFGMQPNSWSYKACLNACAFTKSEDKEVKAQVLKIALKIINLLGNESKGGGLDDFSFRNMFQVLNNQVDDDDERTRYASVIFQSCCEEGYVSRGTLLTIKKHVPKLFYKLPVSAQDRKKLSIPSQWSRNIAKRHRPETLVS